MELNIITPDQSVFSGKATSVTVPGSAGSFEILKDHAPIISTLEDGKVIIRDNKNIEVIIIKGGVVEVLDNKITVLAEGVLEEE
ncbi:ATP synthase F1 subunit epsilon [Olivibacter sp. SDN3]|uniref:ATP synthase F1 subunit epsilon n=1 Tax=Olivibacter sp. SDN3 TaxID=2764720 RepID=UPI001651690E|nr:ATP synthase F1 subunit epsilon [Olivibacter sp. SDN3]QNL52236.1 ATP synthase F1 subunit epsilon [Olivibacter sp. SDN3]